MTRNISDIPIAEMGTEELCSFLHSSRKEHVKRIKKEIERLHDLEKLVAKPDFLKEEIIFLNLEQGSNQKRGKYYTRI